MVETQAEAEAVVNKHLNHAAILAARASMSLDRFLVDAQARFVEVQRDEGGPHLKGWTPDS
jgi:hypothetical protein